MVSKSKQMTSYSARIWFLVLDYLHKTGQATLDFVISRLHHHWKASCSLLHDGTTGILPYWVVVTA